MSWKILLFIGSGSFIGGILRYMASWLFASKVPHGFPWGTFVVNVTGCFFIGLVYGWIAQGRISGDWRLFLTTGVLGGFTTFSAFSHESVTLIHNGHQGLAATYVISSVVLGLVATIAGIAFARLFG